MSTSYHSSIFTVRKCGVSRRHHCHELRCVRAYERALTARTGLQLLAIANAEADVEGRQETEVLMSVVSALTHRGLAPA